MSEVTYKMIVDAFVNVREVAIETPLITSHKLSKALYFKAENTQRTGSFKIRGAYNKIKMLTDQQKKKGIATCSAGNHAQGVALSATKNGISSYICMPKSAPKMKIEATKGYGANVILVDGNFDDCVVECERLIKENGYTYVHPFDDEYVIAGQGSVGLEILEAYSDVEQVIVPIGGGGLISGIAIAIKHKKPDCKVIGVQSKNIPSMYESYKNKKITTIKDNKSIADGLHVLTPGVLTYDIVSKYVDDIVLVSEEEIYESIFLMMQYPKLVVEGAGAVATAAYMSGKVDKTKKTVCIASGGNIDMTMIGSVIDSGIKAIDIK